MMLIDKCKALHDGGAININSIFNRHTIDFGNSLAYPLLLYFDRSLDNGFYRMRGNEVFKMNESKLVEKFFFVRM